MEGVVIALLIICSSFNVGCSNNNQKYTSMTYYCNTCGKQLFYHDTPVPDGVIFSNGKAYCNEKCLYETHDEKSINAYKKQKEEKEKKSKEEREYAKCSICNKRKLKSEMTDISNGAGLEYWCGCHEQIDECYRCCKPIYDNEKYYVENLHTICSECHDKENQ